MTLSPFSGSPIHSQVFGGNESKNRGTGITNARLTIEELWIIWLFGSLFCWQQNEHEWKNYLFIWLYNSLFCWKLISDCNNAGLTIAGTSELWIIWLFSLFGWKLIVNWSAKLSCRKSYLFIWLFSLFDWKLIFDCTCALTGDISKASDDCAWYLNDIQMVFKWCLNGI